MFLAGKPIIEAYDYERRQNWAGMIFAPSVLVAAQPFDLVNECTTYCPNDQAFPRIAEFLAWKAFVQRWREIPFHADEGTDSHDALAIVPGGGTTLRGMVDNLSIAMERLAWLKMLAPSPKEQKKYSASLKFLKSIRDTWSTRADEYRNWQNRIEAAS